MEIFFDIYLYFWMEKKLICQHITAVLNRLSHTSAYGFWYRIVMLVVQRIMIFGLVVIEKMEITFFIIVVLLFYIKIAKIVLLN